MVVIPRRDGDEQQRAHGAEIGRAARDAHVEEGVGVPAQLRGGGGGAEAVAERDDAGGEGEREGGAAQELGGLEGRGRDCGVDDADAEGHVFCADGGFHGGFDEGGGDAVFGGAGPRGAVLDWVRVGFGDGFVGVQVEDLGEVLGEVQGADCGYVGGEDWFADVEFGVFEEGVEGFGELEGV